MAERKVQFVLTADGAARVIARALELLAEIEQTDEALLSDEVLVEARQLRAVVDEWVEWREAA